MRLGNGFRLRGNRRRCGFDRRARCSNTARNQARRLQDTRRAGSNHRGWGRWSRDWSRNAWDRDRGLRLGIDCNVIIVREQLGLNRFFERRRRCLPSVIRDRQVGSHNVGRRGCRRGLSRSRFGLADFNPRELVRLGSFDTARQPQHAHEQAADADEPVRAIAKWNHGPTFPDRGARHQWMMSGKRQLTNPSCRSPARKTGNRIREEAACTAKGADGGLDLRIRPARIASQLLAKSLRSVCWQVGGREISRRAYSPRHG